MIIYTVKNGDTLYEIANRYGTSPEILARDNQLATPAALTVGETLVILQPKTVYTVREGENLYGVAQRFGVSIGDLWRNNAFLGGRTDLSAGEVLTIVPEDPTYGREVATNLFVYPSVDRAVLRTALPFLTYLTLFAYGVEEDGELVDIDGEEEIIDLARQYGVAPIMLVASLNEEGKFSPDVAERVLGDAAVRATLIEEIAAELRSKRYAGVEIDFEYVPAEYAEAYVDFIRQLRERISPDGYRTFVSLAPKTSADQPGLLYEGHDYNALGEVSDGVFVMTYEWGYAYGPPMAVSPVDKVSDVLDYAVSEIPREKIKMGVPNYGYDWTLPFVAGESRARSLGNVEAVGLAAEKRAAIGYDEVSEAPNYRYFDTASGRAQEHVVWFENARSVRALIDLVERYGLNGFGIWNGMRPFPQLWLVLNGTYRIGKVLG